MLVARRGLGADELALASPAFAAAVRWALFAEAVGADLAELRAIAATGPPDELTGQARTEFMASRARARTELAEREALLFPEGD